MNLGLPKAKFTADQSAVLARLDADVAQQLAAKPKRLAHSRSVAQTAEGMAVLYGVDPFLAGAAGLLHDWEKAKDNDLLVARSRELGIDLGVDLELVKPLLHGMVAARELPALYPELPDEVWHAISVHTTGGATMSGLDMVLFVADGIEPLRPKTPGIQRTRDLVTKATPLEDVYWDSFVGGIVYVLQGGRYLYPGALATYNELAARRRAGKTTKDKESA